MIDFTYRIPNFEKYFSDLNTRIDSLGFCDLFVRLRVAIGAFVVSIFVYENRFLSVINFFFVPFSTYSEKNLFQFGAHFFSLEM